MRKRALVQGGTPDVPGPVFWLRITPERRLPGVAASGLVPPSPPSQRWARGGITPPSRFFHAVARTPGTLNLCHETAAAFNFRIFTLCTARQRA